MGSKPTFHLYPKTILAICEICMVKRTFNLNDEITKSEMGGLRYTCTVCGRSTAARVVLREMVVECIKNNEKLTLECNGCGETSTHTFHDSIGAGAGTGAGMEVFTCDVCGSATPVWEIFEGVRIWIL
jgi:hypothetical protein